MSENEQSTLITVGSYQAYLNLSMYGKDSMSPFYGPILKGTWSFMTTYPKQNDQPPKGVLDAFEVTHFFYDNEAEAKAAVAHLVRTLEADWSGWGAGFSGMPSCYIEKKRVRHDKA
jgi:hypothetical protein